MARRKCDLVMHLGTRDNPAEAACGQVVAVSIVSAVTGPVDCPRCVKTATYAALRMREARNGQR